jgi:16S rRNA A1518/A1519 N6-dimethyltransferase RsmA/KsgA/DIM1 with predicted DNA glycosylase/AP lyase activity
VVEIGAGLGDLSAGLLDGATGRSSPPRRLVLTETDPVCLRALGERFAGRPEVEIVAADPATLKVDPPAHTVLAVNILERLTDHVEALR